MLFFRRDQIFLKTSLRGIFVCSKSVPFLSAIDFSNFAWNLSMQSNFTSYNKVCSSVSFVASIDELTISSCVNHKDRFPRFSYVNCLLIIYSVYCISVLSKIKIELFTATARRWPRCCRNFFCGWRKLERTWTFLSCIHLSDVVLMYCLDIKEGNWLHYSLTSLCWWIKLHRWFK